MNEMNRDQAEQPFAMVHFNAPTILGPAMVFTDFTTILAARTPAEVPACLDAVDLWVQRGYYAVGYVAFEAAPALDPCFPARHCAAVEPVAWFGICAEKNANAATGRHNDRLQCVTIPHGEERVDPQPDRRQTYELAPWKADLTEEQYCESCAAILQRITDGDTYQVNFTFPLHSRFCGSIYHLYHDLRRVQCADYNAWIYTGAQHVVSVSPELFFERRGDSIRSIPMKGTRSRGRTTAEDRAIRDQLQHDPKDRAENIMIVDMVRNDLGRIATVGSVAVPSCWSIEMYPTVVQMTSVVTASVDEDVSLLDIMKAAFPPASVTGAPKVETMRIIAASESSPRGVYCGAVGVVVPGGDAVFNVAIRTLTISNSGAACYHVGSGIVADSTCADEYQECLVKSRCVAGTMAPEFSLFETLRYRPNKGYELYDAHLERMADSARYFGFPWSRERIEQRIRSCSADWCRDMRVRILLHCDGSVEIESAALPPAPTCVQVRLADHPVDDQSPFLFHKTTNRSVYDKARSNLTETEDMIFFNQRGEITESTIANIAVKIDDVWYTPPISCGLLAGTRRNVMLEAGEISERIIHSRELARDSNVMLFNSVRGCYSATYVSSSKCTEAAIVQ